jgi:hypothetical protein
VRYLITGGADLSAPTWPNGWRTAGTTWCCWTICHGQHGKHPAPEVSSRMEYHLDGIENRQLVAELVDDADIVVHLAAAVGVKLSWKARCAPSKRM